MTGFPFDPARLLDLAVLAAALNAQGAPPPISDPVVIDEEGVVGLPLPGQGDVFRATPLHAGLTLQWAPMEMQGGAMFVFWGGEPENTRADVVSAFLTRNGLRTLIRDLSSIEASL